MFPDVPKVLVNFFIEYVAFPCPHISGNLIEAADDLWREEVVEVVRFMVGLHIIVEWHLGHLNSISRLQGRSVTEKTIDARPNQFRSVA